MPRYLLVGDIHLSDRPPSSCTDTYLEDLFVILEHTVRLESEMNIDAVVWSGDVFHHKQPSRTSHRTVQRAINLVQQYKRLRIVPGNHDMLNDRYESLFESQPLGVLFQAGATLLNGWDDELPLLYGIPWKQHWDEYTVNHAFEDWNAEFNELRVTPNDRPQAKDCLVVTHAPLYPPGIELPYEYYPSRDEPERQGWSGIQRQGYCYYGHVHDHHGVWTVGDVTFCNMGAITRGSLHESELTRSIAVTVWDPDKGFQRVDVPHKPADQVFRLMEAREKEDRVAAASEFLAGVGKAQLEVLSIEGVIQHITELRSADQITDEVARVATRLLQGQPLEA